jgi:hypothetical protein
MNTQSVGIFNFGDSAIISGNNVFANDEGIFNTNAGTAAATTTISGNTAHNNRFQGIILSSGTANVSNNTITENNIGIAIRASDNTVASQGTLISNNILNNGKVPAGFPGGGIVLLQIPGVTTLPMATAHFNRIVGNSVGLDNSRVNGATSVDAMNNWWGSNAGPAVAGKGSDTAVGPVNFIPWLVLTITATPTIVPVGGVATIVAALTMNSLGQNTSALGHVPNGIPVMFHAGAGTIAPVQTVLVNGMAVARFTAGIAFGAITVSAKVDNQIVFAVLHQARRGRLLMRR